MLGEPTPWQISQMLNDLDSVEPSMTGDQRDRYGLLKRALWKLASAPYRLADFYESLIGQMPQEPRRV
jgi:hypothetical protein